MLNNVYHNIEIDRYINYIEWNQPAVVIGNIKAGQIPGIGSPPITMCQCPHALQALRNDGGEAPLPGQA